MLAAVLALALTLDPASPAADDSGVPLQDSQAIRTIVPRADGFDVYWFRYNELREPAISRLFRTSLDLEGRITMPATVVAAPAEIWLSSGPALPLAYWKTDDGTVYAAPLTAGVPSSGNVVATRATGPSIHCEGSFCLARWTTPQYTGRGAFLDLSGNVVSGPFALPGAHYDLLPVSLEEEGAALVAAGAVRYSVVRLARDGAVRANVPFLDHTVYTTAALSHDGERAIAAYIARPWPDEPPSLEVSAVAVAADGQTENLGTIFAPPGAVHLTGLAMAWNGTTHLLVGGYVNSSVYEKRLFAVELDRQLHVVGATDIPASFPYGTQFEVIPNGDRFAIGWNGAEPHVAVYRDGKLSEPVTMETPPRRRLVRR